MAERLHLLFVTSSLGGGGAEMHMLRLMNGLDKKRFRVSLVAMRPGGEFEPGMRAGIDVYYTSGRSWLRALVSLWRLVRLLRPDAMYSCLILVNCLVIAAARLSRRRPSVVISVQNPPWTMYRGLRERGGYVVLALIRLLYPAADRVVCISQGVCTDLARVAPIPLASVSVVPNIGCDPSKHTAAGVDDHAAEQPLVVGCGRLVPQKGFLYLIRALSIIRTRLPAHLRILGEGPERSRLEEEVNDRGLGAVVRLPGFSANPYPTISAAQVFALSSIHEGFGNVIVEAMACGTAVVATDCPYGPSEIIEHGVTGLLVPPADEDSLARAILQVLSDPVLRQRLEENGRRRAQSFRPEVIVPVYEDLFLEVACDNSSP